MDEGFHNVLSAICSATLGYCGVLTNCSATECHDLFHNLVTFSVL